MVELHPPHVKRHEITRDSETQVAFDISYALQHRMEQVMAVLPFLSTGIRETGDITISPYQEQGGRVSHVDILFRGNTTGLQITETALEFVLSEQYNPIRIDSGKTLVQALQYTNNVISEGMLNLPVDIDRKLEYVHRDAVSDERIKRATPRYDIQSIREIPELVQRELQHIVADEMDIPFVHLHARTLRDRRGIVGYEWYRQIENRQERVLRTDTQGKVTWGWGYLQHGQQSFSEHVEQMRADIAQSLVIPSIDRQLRQTPDGIAAVDLFSSMIKVSLQGQIEIVGKRVRSDRQLARFLRQKMRVINPSVHLVSTSDLP